MEGYLEEMLLLAQRAEEYNQFMLAKMTEALAPAPLPAARHNDFRRVMTALGRWPGLCNQQASGTTCIRLDALCCRAGSFNVAVRELLNYYVAMEEFVMEKDVQTAISIRELSPGNLTTSMVRIHMTLAVYFCHHRIYIVGIQHAVHRCRWTTCSSCWHGVGGAPLGQPLRLACARSWARPMPSWAQPSARTSAPSWR